MHPGVHEDVHAKTRHAGRGHIPALDGIRGAAVLGVVASHLFVGNFAVAGRAGPILLGVLNFGVHGVSLFFVLSGFLITGILRDSLSDGQFFRKFYARRVLRIFPLYYGVILLLVVLTRPLEMHWRGMLPSLLLYLQNTSLLAPLATFGDQRFVSIDHLWSLAVEEQFYLVWPLLVFLVRSPSRLLALCFAGCAFALALRTAELVGGGLYTAINRNTFCRMDDLLAGAVLALLLRSRFAERTVRAGVLLTMAGLGCLWGLEPLLAELRGGAMTVGEVAWLTAAGYTSVTVASVGLMCWAMRQGSVAQRLFQARVLRFLGKYSYGIYVLHALPRPALELLLPRLHAAGLAPVPARLLTGCVGLGLSITAAYLSFQLYEKRFLRLKRFFDYAPAPAAAGPVPLA